MKSKQPKDLNVNEKKGMPSQNHWQMDVGQSVFPRYRDNPRDAFLAGNGKDRPQPHVKVNECDH